MIYFSISNKEYPIKQALIDFLNTFMDLQKAIVMLLLMLMGIVFRLENMISGAELVDLLKNTVVAFYAVQATAHIVSSVKAYYVDKNAPDTDTADQTVAKP